MTPEELYSQHYAGQMSDNQYYAELFAMGIENPPMPKRRKLHVKLPQPIIDKLYQFANDRGIPMSEAAARAIVEYMK